VLLLAGALTLATLALLPPGAVRNLPATSISASAIVFDDEPGPSDHELLARSAADQRRSLAAAQVQAAQAQAHPPSIHDIIAEAFAPLGDAAVGWALQIAYCESTYNPSAVNTDSNAEGLFQFLPSTWAGTPFAAQSPFDPVANAHAAAWLLATYGPGQWECQA